jgi:hypothetical protein
VAAVIDTHELDRNAQTPVDLPNRPLEHGIHAEFPADLAHVEPLSLELEGRRAGCHPHGPHLGEGARDFLGDPIAEVLVVRIGAQIDERQHSDRYRPGVRPADDRRRNSLGEIGS